MKTQRAQPGPIIFIQTILKPLRYDKWEEPLILSGSGCARPRSMSTHMKPVVPVPRVASLSARTRYVYMVITGRALN